MEDCIFCKIIARELPSWKLYEDEHTLAFLDIFPVHKGHTLIVPKKHCADFVSADSQCLQSVLATTQNVSRAVLSATGADGCNITTNNGAAAGQEIFHLHWHIIPRFKNDGLHLWPQASYAEGEKETFQENIKKYL